MGHLQSALELGPACRRICCWFSVGWAGGAHGRIHICSSRPLILPGVPSDAHSPAPPSLMSLVRPLWPSPQPLTPDWSGTMFYLFLAGVLAFTSSSEICIPPGSFSGCLSGSVSLSPPPTAVQDWGLQSFPPPAHPNPSVLLWWVGSHIPVCLSLACSCGLWVSILI